MHADKSCTWKVLKIWGNNTETARAMEMQNAIFTFSGIAACDRSLTRNYPVA